jgi:hypothetical protein
MSDPRYDAAWHDLADRVAVMRLAERGWLVALLVLLTGLYVTRTNQVIGWLVSGAGVVAQLAFRAYADALLKGFHCPRCGAPFVQVAFFGRLPLQAYDLRAPCQKCRLPLGATSEGFDRAL